MELEARLQTLSDLRVQEEAAFEQISRMPGTLCDTLQQVCSQMVRAKTAEDARRAKERRLFYGELNSAHAMLADTEAALQKQTESVYEVGCAPCTCTPHLEHQSAHRPLGVSSACLGVWQSGPTEV